MQDNLPRSKVEEVRSVEDERQLQSVPPTRESFADERCVQSEEEMKKIFASVRPQLPVLPSRIERPETLGKVLLKVCLLNVPSGFLHSFAFLGRRTKLPPSELAQSGDEPAAGCCQ